MNIRTRTILTAVAFAAAASALGSSGANQDAFFAQQRQVTDGYYPQFPIRERTASTKPATPHQTAENKWFELERARGSGNVKPVPFSAAREAAFASNTPPESAMQLARDH